MKWALENSIPIDTAIHFEDSEKSLLRQYYVYTVEDLIGLSSIGPLKSLLANLLRINPSEVDQLNQDLRSTIQDSKLLKILAPVEESELVGFSFGSLKPPEEELKRKLTTDWSEFASEFFVEPIEFSEVNHIPSLFPVKAQGKRGTCVGFGTTALMEFLFQKSVELSEQFLYWGAKRRDGRPDSPGTWIRYAMMCLEEDGICERSVWPYNPVIQDSEHQGPPSEEAIENARKYRISRKIQINPNSVNDLRRILAGDQQFPGRVISFAIPVFNSWLRNPVTYTTGKIAMPLPEEEPVSGHCMTLAGYKDASDWPGGGFFIFRNSWGEKWASESDYGSGYGMVPYAFMSQYCWEAWTADIEGLTAKAKTVEKKQSSGVEKSNPMIIGKKLSKGQKANDKNRLFLGYVDSSDQSPIHIDVSFPHIGLICGSRGSGKSYTLGVMVEEINKKAKDIGVVLVDPLGIFWSLKERCKSGLQIAGLKRLGLTPGGLEHVEVLAPDGAYRDNPLSYLDGSFSIKVSDLDADDWCSIFDIDPFAPQGLLLTEAIRRTREGYLADQQGNLIQRPAVKDYTLGDLIECINHSSHINDMESGFRKDTRRSIIYRLKGAAGWGIFTLNGTGLNQLVKKGHVTVLDLSHPELDENLRALVVGVMAKKILAARILVSKKDVKLPNVNRIPVTWLMIDEAHLFIPRGRKGSATKPLTEYAKLGRQPGCALVMATQRPKATDDEIVSQADIVIGHKLAFEDDITALFKRMPCSLDESIKDMDFIRNLSTGSAVVGDQYSGEPGRIVKFRPRLSHHAGEEAKPDGG